MPTVTDYYRQGPAERPPAKEKKVSTEQALEKFSSAMIEYGQHLKSHTSAIISLRGAVQEIRNSVEAANKILNHLHRNSLN
ncbi:hypothetical protein ACFLYC_00640 [Chloroflexota bacterium]